MEVPQGSSPVPGVTRVASAGRATWPTCLKFRKETRMSMNNQGNAARELQVRDQLGNLLHEIERLDKAISQLSERLSPVLFHRDQTGEKESVQAPGLCDLAARSEE